jgi:hypothetical protein
MGNFTGERAMDVLEYQKRLENTFSVDGVAGGPLLEVLGAAPCFCNFRREGANNEGP